MTTTQPQKFSEKLTNLFQEIQRREYMTISSILYNKECREFATHNEIKEDLFNAPRVRLIMRAFNAASISGEEPTFDMIIDQIGPKNITEREQWHQYFEKIKTNFTPDTKVAFDQHLKLLESAKNIAKLHGMATGMLQKMDDLNITDLLEENSPIEQYIESTLFDYEEEKKEKETEQTSANISEGLSLTKTHLKKVAKGTGEDEFITTGYPELDEKLGKGVNKGSFAIIAARPAMGKTVTMINIGLEAAKQGAKVLFISIEMSLIQCYQRVLSKMSEVKAGRLQIPEELTDDEWARIDQAVIDAKEVYDDRFFLEEVVSLTAPQLERMIKRYKKKFDIDMVIVDYVQIMATKDGREPETENDYAQISGGLRKAAKSQKVAIIVGSQLNRAVENRPDKRPIMADLRNSGALEQDSPQIIGLYRDKVYNPETEKPNTLELVILKNRFGDIGSVELSIDLTKQGLYSQYTEEKAVVVA